MLTYGGMCAVWLYVKGSTAIKYLLCSVHDPCICAFVYACVLKYSCVIVR